MTETTNWIIQFNKLCTISGKCLDIVNDPLKLDSVLSRYPRVNDHNINKILHDQEQLMNLRMSFKTITPYDSDMPTGTHEIDIYLYYTKYILNPKVDIWHTFIVNSKGIPERTIISAILRLKLLSRIYDDDVAETIRYCMLYSIFRFHYTNIQFIREYMIAIADSLLGRGVIIKDEIINTFLKLMKRDGLELIEKHMKTIQDSDTEIDFHNVHDEMTRIYKYIGMFERLILFHYSSCQLCPFHLKDSIWDIKPSEFHKIGNIERISYSSCTCKKIVIDKSKTPKYIDQLKNMSNDIVRENHPRRFNFDW